MAIFMKSFIAVMLLTSLLINHVGASTKKTDYRIPKRFNLSICAIFHDESEFLKEWIEYHRLVGVDHFYLYNNGSTDKYLSVLNPYIYEDIVTLVEWHGIGCSEDCEISDCLASLWSLSTQVTAYENAIKIRACYETRWLVFLDIDEFLVPKTADNLVGILEKHSEKPGIVISSNYYSAVKESNIVTGNLLIEALTIINKPKGCIQKEVSKTIFKPELCTHFTWPPYKCTFKDHQNPIRLSKDSLCINRYCNRDSCTMSLRNDPSLFLNNRLLNKKLDVDQRFLDEEQVDELLQDGYEFIDHERPIYRFVPSLLQKMGFTAHSSLEINNNF